MKQPRPIPSQAKLCRRFVVVSTLALITLQPVLQAASSVPGGGAFTAGSGNILTSGNAVVINQSTLRGIIDWRTFSIGAGASVHFNNGAGATLNRVTGSAPTSILGQLLATGNIYILNPQGILIGHGATIRTGGDFVASTLNLPDNIFLSGGPLTFSGASTATVVNLGILSSSGGSVYLIGHSVNNAGSILTPNGTTGLAAGGQVLISDTSTNQKVAVQAPGGDVTNSGFIAAAEAELKSNNGNIYALAGNNAGAIQATGTATQDGHIWLVATHGTANIAGLLSATNANGTGGAIETSGAQVKTSGARITTGKGGSWLLDPDDLTIDLSLATTIDGTLGGGTDVTEQTGNGNSGNGDIFLESPIAWSTGANLTLSAFRNINLDAGISSTGSGNLTLRADNTAIGTGTILGSGVIDFSASTGSVALLYNPSGGYASPTSYAANFAAANSAWAAPVNGSVSSQYTAYMLVNNPGDLQNLDLNDAGVYALGQDVDLSSILNFAPLGATTPFTGILDGMGHTASNLTINDASGINLGLFSVVGNGGRLRNLSLTNANVTETGGSSSIGTLVGISSGTISNTSVAGALVLPANPTYVGGLVGNSNGTVQYSSSTVTMDASLVTGGPTLGGLVGQNLAGIVANSNATTSINASNASGGDVGGLIGYSSGPVSTSYATGAVTVANSANAGGLVGFTDSGGAITGSHASGLVSGVSSVNEGGLVGVSNDSITTSYASGNVTASGTDSSTGGLVGSASASILNSSASGSVSTGNFASSGAFAGGLVGYNNAAGTITTSFATGSVLGGGSTGVGGLIGNNNAAILNSYATGAVTAGFSANAGGLVGTNNGTIDSSSATGSVAADDGSNAGGLAGYSIGAITNSHASGTVNLASASSTGDPSSGNNAGGLVGFADSGGTIASSSYASGAVTGGDYAKLGGLTGANRDAISDSYATGSVTGGMHTTGGGLSGFGEGNISESYALGSVSAGADSAIGGLVGYAAISSIVDTYAHGAVTATAANGTAGGLIGELDIGGSVATSYSSGLVTAPSPLVSAGLIATVYDASSVTSSYWDSQRSGFPTIGVGNVVNGSSPDVSPLTTAQLQSGSLPAGFSGSIWTAPAGGYPFFGWQGALVTISGTAYSGSTGIASAPVNVLSSGFLLGSLTADSSGFYTIAEPQNQVASGVLTYLTGGGTANTFSDGGANGLNFAGMDLHLNTLSLLNATSTSLSSLNAALAHTLGGNSGAAFLFSVPSGQLSLNAGTDLSLVSSAPSFTVDQNLSTSGNIAINSGGNLSIAAASSLTAGSGDGITLNAGGIFTNNGGANALNVSGGGNWLVYSQNPANDSPDSLAEDFIQYDATYGVTAPAHSGNGLLYTLTPTLTASLTGTATKTYDGNTSASLSSITFTATGGIQGDTLSFTAGGAAYDSPNVSSNAGDGEVTASGLAVTAMNGGIPVYGYQLASTSPFGNIGTINPALLQYTATAASGTYGAANPAFSGSVTGFVNGQNVGSATTGTLAFASTAGPTSNVGSYAINGSGLTANNGNYTLGQAPGNTTAFTINPATLTYTASPAPSQTYGASDPLFSGTVTGFVNGQNVASATTGTLAFVSNGGPTSNVGSYYINGSGLTANFGNYNFVQALGNATRLSINPAFLTYVATAASGTYGSANPAFTGGVTGFVNGQNVGSATTGTLAFGSSAGPTSNVGTYAINGSGLTANFGNYNFLQAEPNITAFTINPALLQYTATAASGTYGAANPAFSGSVTGFVNGQNVGSATTGTLAFASSAGPTSNVGTYAINGSGLTANFGNYNFLQAEPNITAFTINPALLQYTATAASGTYGAANPAFSGSVTGFVNGQNVGSATTGTLAFASTAGPTSNVGSYAINGSGLTANNGNYTLGQAPGNTTAFTINPATLTYTASPAPSQTYGASDPLFSGTVTGFVNGQNVASATTGTLAFVSNGGPTSNVGSYYINGSGLTANFGNYNFVQALGNATRLSINPAFLTYVATAASGTYGSANPAFTGGVTGFVNGQNVGSATTGTLAFGSSAGPTSNVGTYAINGSGLTANFGNYNFLQAEPNITAFTINPALLQYTATAASGTYGAANPAFSGSVTGFVNGQNVGSATTGTLAFASTAGPTSNVGSYAINGSGLTANNGNYTFAQAAGNPTAFTINPATLTYTASPAPSQTYGASDPLFSGTVTGFVNGQNVASATTGTLAFVSNGGPTSNVGSYYINGSGLTANFGNYNFVQALGNATRLSINPAFLTYVATAASGTYGSANPAFTGGVTGFVNGQNVGSATTGTLAFGSSAGPTSNVGTYAINGSGLTANFGNYNFLQAEPNITAFTINPALLQYTATAASGTYGAANPAFSGSVTGFVNGQNVGSATTGTLAFASTAGPTSNVGSYAINGSGLTANNGNYTLGQASGNTTAFTINPATLTYTASPAPSQIYGASNSLFSGTVTGFVNEQNLASATTGTASFTSPALPTSNVGTYAIDGSGLTAVNGNYNFVQALGNATRLSINPAFLTYVATAASGTYGSANPAFTGGVTGFVNGQNVGSATSGTLAFGSSAGPTSNVGTYAINGSGLTANFGNYTFIQAEANVSSLTINPATLFYTANATSQTYGSINPTYSGTLTGFVNGQTQTTITTGTASFSSPATAASNVGTYPINGSGLTANNGNYTLAQAAGNATALTINPALLTYIATAASQPYGFTDPTFTGTVAGFVNGQNLATATTGAAVFASPANAASLPGQYSINGSGLTAQHGNYLFTQAPGNATALTVAAAIPPIPPPTRTQPATLTISINDSVNLSGQTPAFSASYSGPPVSGLNIASLLAGLTYQITPALNGPGTYRVTATGTAPPGYTYNIAPAYFTVIDSSPATIPSELPIFTPELPDLLIPLESGTAANLFLPANAIGIFQVAVENRNGGFGAFFAGFVQQQAPLAESSFFNDPDQKRTTYTAGAKPSTAALAHESIGSQQ